MILYRQFDCDRLSEINDEIIEFINNLTFDQDVFWNPVDIKQFVAATPTLTAWLLSNQLPVRTVAITRGLHDRCCGPHTDTPPSRYKLSWPVQNTERTWNRWFTADQQASRHVNDLGGVTYTDPTQLTEIGRMRVDRPAIIATGIPHDVWCEADAVFPRWGLQCQLFNEPEHL